MSSEPIALNAALDDLQRALRGQHARRVEQPDHLDPAPGLVIDPQEAADLPARRTD